MVSCFDKIGRKQQVRHQAIGKVKCVSIGNVGRLSTFIMLMALIFNCLIEGSQAQLLLKNENGLKKPMHRKASKIKSPS